MCQEFFEVLCWQFTIKEVSLQSTIYYVNSKLRRLSNPQVFPKLDALIKGVVEKYTRRRRVDCRPFINKTQPIGKIYHFGKNFVSFEPIVQFNNSLG